MVSSHLSRSSLRRILRSSIVPWPHSYAFAASAYLLYCPATLSLHGQQQLKEDEMLAVHLAVIDGKLGVPDVGLGDIVVGGQLVLILEICILDVLR